MKYLLTLSLGPVQDFIAAGRKTADLYAGSDLLVSMARVVARLLAEHGQLIFPANPESDGANKILILLEEGKDPAALAQSAKEAAQAELERVWTQALGRLEREQRALIHELRATTQISSFLEVYAAWVPIEPLGYAQARQKVDRLLAGRKALRDFSALEQQDEGVPKSLLDPARASVFRALERGGPLLGDPLHLKGNEFLDAVSVLKRIHGFKRFKDVVQTRTLAQRSKQLEFENDEWGHVPEGDEQTPDYPYFALLVADGDKMGQRISDEDNPEAHRKLSAALGAFAKQAQGIVEEHKGRCVYAGGDDVLGFLPVSTAVPCAEQLARAFTKVGAGLTLSVGVAIVHYREPLSVSLEQARAAEKAAKNKKAKDPKQHGNRLALALHTRGGAPLEVIYPWDELKPLENALHAYAEGTISRGFPYELRELAREWPSELETPAGMEVLTAEVGRILKRKRVQGGGKATLELPVFAAKRDLERYADTLILARFLSRQTEIDHA